MELGGRHAAGSLPLPKTQRAKSSVVVLLPQRIVATRRSARGSTIGQDMHPPRTPAIEQRGPLADRLAGNPSLLTRLWFVCCRACVSPGCNDECGGPRRQSVESAPRINRPTSMARAERGEDHQKRRTAMQSHRSGRRRPEIGGQVDHARCSGSRSKDSWQHGNIVFMLQQQPTVIEPADRPP